MLLGFKGNFLNVDLILKLKCKYEKSSINE